MFKFVLEIANASEEDLDLINQANALLTNDPGITEESKMKDPRVILALFVLLISILVAILLHRKSRTGSIRQTDDLSIKEGLQSCGEPDVNLNTNGRLQNCGEPNASLTTNGQLQSCGEPDANLTTNGQLQNCGEPNSSLTTNGQMVHYANPGAKQKRESSVTPRDNLVHEVVREMARIFINGLRTDRGYMPVMSQAEVLALRLLKNFKKFPKDISLKGLENLKNRDIIGELPNLDMKLEKEELEVDFLAKDDTDPGISPRLESLLNNGFDEVFPFHSGYAVQKKEDKTKEEDPKIHMEIGHKRSVILNGQDFYFQMQRTNLTALELNVGIIPAIFRNMKERMAMSRFGKDEASD